MLKKIKLQNFRSYSSLELYFSRGTILIGKNAEGKTNILEAVHFLSSTKSFRVTKDLYLIKFEEPFASMEGELGNLNLRTVIESNFDVTKKTLQRKGVKTSARNILGEYLSVIFSPEDVSFLNNSPSVRRRYLDIVLSMSNKNYLLTLIRYKKILEQRNALLKRIREGKANSLDLPVWNEKMITEGTALIEWREEFIEEVNRKISEFYNYLSGNNEEIKVIYKKSTEVENFKTTIEENKNSDIASGTTNIGPHRDDISFYKNGRETALYGSRGEFRSIVLALKFSEGLFLEEKTGKTVTYLLDDVFSELDKTRRDNLFFLIRDNPFIITTTDLDHIGKELLNISKIFSVSAGEVKEV